MDSLQFYLSGIDLDAFHAINGWSGRNLILDHVVTRLESVQLKSLAFIGTFGAMWFQRSKTQGRQRETLILLFIAIVLSLIAARTFANLLPFRVRPMFTPGIGYRPPLYEIGAYFENWSSFPSDTAAIVFAMTTGYWLLSRWWGLLWAGFSVIAISARICIGLHYPSDALVGALIGVTTMLAINNKFMHERIAAPFVVLEQRAPSTFYGLLFPFIYEVSSLFAFSRGIYHAIVRVFGSLGS
jgi:undecaprenyl-diphosphatase